MSEARWLAWSGGEYPDDSPGDVIAAKPDGTIILDDGITTWNPLRALAWYEQQTVRLTEALERRIAMLERIRRELGVLNEGEDRQDSPLPDDLAALEAAWGLIANASGGDWAKESPEWQAAAARWRDEHWHTALTQRT